MSDGKPVSRSRRQARQVAFQALYMVSVGRADIGRAFEVASQRVPLSDDVSKFCHHLVDGVTKSKRGLDEQIEPFLAPGWTIERLTFSDLIVLRMATYELFHFPGIPPKVTISQAVELAKSFGTKESGAFVNGVLGNLLQATPKAHWDPSQEEVFEDDDDTLVEPDAEVEIVEDDLEPETEVEPLTDEKVSSWVLKSEE